jgi:5'-phosphate synthase pdxT subunit
VKRVGVLALQGDVREHVAALRACNVEVDLVRTPEDVGGLSGLVIPGGESTTIAYLLGTSGLRPVLTGALDDGLPVLGTCAGLIMLSAHVEGGRADQWSFGQLDVTVQRNGYGRQIASFETPIDVRGVGVVPGVFIRAPRITTWGDVEVLATYDHGDGDGDHPVLVRHGTAWGCSFHPELTSDIRVHELFTSSF